MDVIALRLRNHRLTGAPFASAAEAVAWFGAVQAQDFAGARWAVGQRVEGAAEPVVDQAYDAGDILRTHVLRPTWHFVAAADLRWMLALTAPRVKRAMATYDAELGVDDKLFARCNAAILRAFDQRPDLTRPELGAALAQSRIKADGRRLGHLVMRAELDAILCSGPRRGKLLTYTLVDRRCPPLAPADRDALLARLAGRYFVSHGPALVTDFAWWSGLTLSDARRAVAALGKALESHVLGEHTYWFAAGNAPPRKSPLAHLLPNFDEFTVAYRHRAFTPSPALLASLGARPNLLFHNLVLLDGAPIGTWRRATPASPVVLNLPSRLSRPAQRAVDAALDHYTRYLAPAPAPAKRHPAHARRR